MVSLCSGQSKMERNLGVSRGGDGVWSTASFGEFGLATSFPLPRQDACHLLLTYIQGFLRSSTSTQSCLLHP